MKSNKIKNISNFNLYNHVEINIRLLNYLKNALVS